jgi:hypothetical protein
LRQLEIIDTVILDKTGTITVGNRHATEFEAVRNYSQLRLALLAGLASTADETPETRPSAASYDASASASSDLSASNYQLRNRVARTLGPIVRYASGPKKKELVATDIGTWFQQDRYQGDPHVAAQSSVMKERLKTVIF